MDFEKMLEGIIGGAILPPDIKEKVDAVWKVPENQLLATERLIEKLQAKEGREEYDIGDLITPREDAPLKGRGIPHIVINKSPMDIMEENDSHPIERVNGICGVIIKGELSLYAMNTEDYEPFFTNETYRSKDLSTHPWPVPQHLDRAVNDLRKAAEELFNPKRCPFKIGDIVTPKINAHKNGRGAPHYVSMLFDSKIKITFEKPRIKGKISNMVITILSGKTTGERIIEFLNHSDDYELYDVTANY